MEAAPVATYVIEDNMPDMLCFVGSILFFLCFFVAVTEFFEHEGLRSVLAFEPFEYAELPVYLSLGLACGFVSYSLAYTQRPGFGVTDYGHAIFSAAIFFLFAKHLTRRADMNQRRANLVVATGTLPLVCICVLEAETVHVRSCGFFFALMLVFALMPLGTVLKDWRHEAFDPVAGKLRKRLFMLFSAVLCYVALNGPSRLCAKERDKSDQRQAGVLLFELALLYCAHDGLWNS